jgi:hypothetical protein
VLRTAAGHACRRECPPHDPRLLPREPADRMPRPGAGLRAGTRGGSRSTDGGLSSRSAPDGRRAPCQRGAAHNGCGSTRFSSHIPYTPPTCRIWSGPGPLRKYRKLRPTPPVHPPNAVTQRAVQQTTV